MPSSFVAVENFPFVSRLTIFTLAAAMTALFGSRTLPVTVAVGLCAIADDANSRQTRTRAAAIRIQTPRDMGKGYIHEYGEVSGICTKFRGKTSRCWPTILKDVLFPAILSTAYGWLVATILSEAKSNCFPLGFWLPPWGSTVT